MLFPASLLFHKGERMLQFPGGEEHAQKEDVVSAIYVCDFESPRLFINFIIFKLNEFFVSKNIWLVALFQDLSIEQDFISQIHLHLELEAFDLKFA